MLQIIGHPSYVSTVYNNETSLVLWDKHSIRRDNFCVSPNPKHKQQKNGGESR